MFSCWCILYVCNLYMAVMCIAPGVHTYCGKRMLLFLAANRICTCSSVQVKRGIVEFVLHRL